MPVPEMSTSRLLLRGWRPGDAAPFAAMNADPVVMRHFPSTMSAADSAEMLRRIESGFERHGFGLWALEHRETGAFLGFTGLTEQVVVSFPAPVVEVGWRLVADAWGHGYATEAATAALRHAFEVAGLDEVVSMTAATNLRSVAVMERLGMTRDNAADFDHPRVPVGSPLRRHVVYRLPVERWHERLPARP